jgi:hypothetical protein
LVAGSIHTLSSLKALVQVPIPVQVYEINGRMSWPIHRWLFVIVSLFVFKGMVTVMPRLQISKLFMTSFYMASFEARFICQVHLCVCAKIVAQLHASDEITLTSFLL